MATDLTNTRISDGYGQLLHADGGLTATEDIIYDGDGTASVLKIGTASASINDGAYDFDIASHDGSNGLKLGGTLVTSSAAELNYVDITTLGTSQASKAVTVNSSGDLIVPDSDKFKFGAGSDMQLYHDGSNSYITNATGALKLATETSGIVVTIGHTTSETTVADNLTVTGNTSVGGNLTVTGTSTFNGGTITLGDAASDTIAFGGTITGNLVFEGSTSDAHELTLSAGDPAGDVTVTLPVSTDTLVGKATTDTLTNKTLTTPVIAEIDSGSTITLDATTDIVLDAGGADVFLKDDGTTYGSLTNSSGNLIIKSGTTTAATFSGANVTLAGTVGSGAITSTGAVQGTVVTATTGFAPDAQDGAYLGTSSLQFSDLFLADEAVVAFGDDGDVTLTHVHNTGLLLTDDSGVGTTQLQFGDSGTYIYQKADGHLGLVGDTEIDISATTIDINGAVAFDGALTGITNITLSGTLSDGNYTFDTSGNVSGLGTVGSGAITSSGVVTGTGFTIGSAVINEAELETIDGVTAGTVAASKAVVVDSDKDIGTFRNLTIDGVFTDGNYTFDTSGNVTGLGTVASGAITSSGVITGTTIEATGDTSSSDNAAIGYTSAEGLILTGQGSTNDVTIKNDADTDVITIATGGTAVDVVGDLTAGTLNADGDTSAGDNAAIGYTSAEGLILTGQGSTSDVTLKNDADGTVFTVPTGTDDILFPDSAKGMWGASSDMQLYHDGSNSYITNSQGALKVATESSGIAITLGHGTSEVTVADNLTVTGDLTVSGTTTTVSSSTLTIGDSLIKLAQGYTGSAYDQGIVFTRGDGSSSNTQNMAFIYDESADGFATIKAATEAGTTAGNITVTDYMPLRVGALTADDASTFTSTISAATGSTIGNLTLANGSITDSSGAIDFGNETLTTSGVITGGGFTIGSAAILEAELEILDGAAVTTTELNIIDGDTSATGTTLVAADRVVVNDNGTMVQVAMSDFETFMESNLDTLGSVTSLGTLTALTVDDVAINGKVITMTGSTSDTAVFTAGTNGTLSIVTTDANAAAANIQITADGTVDIDSAGVLTLDSGAAINIEPASGSAILLDGTISVDAGVVTGATSITSTAFVGDITGDVTGNTSGTAATVTTAAQTNITSLGTLTALQVDYINANASTLTITDSSDTGDLASIAVTTHGATTLTTTDDDATAAHLTFDADGNITLDSATGIVTMEDGGTEVLRLTEGNSGDVTVKLVTNAKDLIFTDNGDAEGFRISDGAAGVKVAGTIDLGHATDTTIARSGSGAITVEGNQVYLAGGTDVPVADGGTGASSLTANGVLIGNGTSAVSAVDLSTKGHILIGDGSGNPSALSVGSNDYVLTADSGEATGTKWASLSSAAITTSSNADSTTNTVVLYNGTGGTSVDSSGNLTFDGSTLTVTGDAVVTDDLTLNSDSAVFNMGDGNDFTMTHDGTTGITLAATPISINSTGDLTLDSSTDIVLDSAGGNFEFKDSGTTQLTVDVNTTAGDIDVNLDVDGDDLVFNAHGGAEIIRFQDNGNVSIGHTGDILTGQDTASTKLTIYDADDDEPAILEIAGNDTTDNAVLGAIKFCNNDNADATNNDADGKQVAIIDSVVETDDSNAGDDSGAHIRFFTKPLAGTVAQRGVINSEGNWGLGVTTPSTRLDVRGNNQVGYMIFMHNQGDDANRYGIKSQAGANDGSGTTYYFNASDGNGDNTGMLQTVSGTFALADTSDVRLKKDIVDTSIDGLDSVNAMKVRDFKWKKNDISVTAGFIANELKEVCPHVVSGEADAMESYEAEYDEDGEITKEAGERIKAMTVSRDLLVPVLVKAIQELSAKVEALENA